MSGKGSKQRPTDKSKFDANYDAIFKKKDMWEHQCKHNGTMSIAKGQECSWCGDTECMESSPE